MFDANTESVFDQFSGVALTGPMLDAGVELTRIPVITTTWAQWLGDHPDTTVITQANARSGEYAANPLRDRDLGGPVFPVGDTDVVLSPNTEVFGVTLDDGTTVAFPVEEARGHPGRRRDGGARRRVRDRRRRWPTRRAGRRHRRVRSGIALVRPGASSTPRPSCGGPPTREWFASSRSPLGVERGHHHSDSQPRRLTPPSRPRSRQAEVGSWRRSARKSTTSERSSSGAALIGTNQQVGLDSSTTCSPRDGQTRSPSGRSDITDPPAVADLDRLTFHGEMAETTRERRCELLRGGLCIDPRHTPIHAPAGTRRRWR